eukprot:TRINITY_DN3449_c0_g1_i2.p1 TRINITY_DN3449_c0_g1~~TRINITY_DN3449_c0_g1_i2.p1  ORF type:complete len:286 (+),score=56.61 TRINITY_DN3449_c0_g1_i2:40-897(+)
MFHLKRLATWVLLGKKAPPAGKKNLLRLGYPRVEKAVLWGSDEEAMNILADLNKNRRSITKTRLLMSAAANGLSEKCKFLIEQGADVNYENDRKSNAAQLTPLHAAAAAGCPDLCELLIDSNAQVNTSSYTPLMVAAKNDNAAAAKLLIEKGAIKGILYNERSARHLCGVGTATRALLSCSAEPYVQCNEATRTAIQTYKPTQKRSIMRGCILSGHADEVDCLLSLGVSPTTRVKKGVTAMQFAAEHGTSRIYYTLKEYDSKTPTPSAPPVLSVAGDVRWLFKKY